MTELFIAEKKEVALSLAQAISGEYTMKKGYLIGTKDNRHYTWCMGHLVKLVEPEKFNEAWKFWSWDNLPIIPPRIEFEPIDDPFRKTQLNTIKTLAFSKEITSIVVATDSAIEGQVIYMSTKMFLKLNKPEMRLWTASLQPTAIRKAYKDMKPNSAYKGLTEAGLTRMLSDFIIGLTATRALTLSAQGSSGGNKIIIQAGRVMSPLLSLVYDRDKLRNSFSKIKYYPVKMDFNQKGTIYTGYLKTEKITDKSTSESIRLEVENGEAEILNIVQKEKQIQPPKLHDLTSVSKIASSKFGYSGTKTLAILQHLYLSHIITYPRTDESIVSDEEIPFMRNTFDALKEIYPNLSKNGDIQRVSTDNKRICNPAALKDHHAILPEAVKVQNLTEEQANVYHIILENFFAQFQEPYQYIQKNITTVVNTHTFESSYSKPIVEGWKAILRDNTEEDLSESEESLIGLPEVERGAVKVVQGELLEKETAPPAAYTDGTLMDAMTNISKTITDPVLKAKIRENGIGTSATRAGTIQKLIDTEYLMYNGKKAIVITKKGEQVIELIRASEIKLLTSAELTAVWEKELDEIKNGKPNTAFMKGIYAFANQIVAEAQKLKFTPENFHTFVGECPKCKKGLIESAKKYSCIDLNKDCDFFIWKSQFNKTINHTMLQQLLKKGETNTYTFTSSKGQKYKAKLSISSECKMGSLKLNF